MVQSAFAIVHGRGTVPRSITARRWYIFESGWCQAAVQTAGFVRGTGRTTPGFSKDGKSLRKGLRQGTVGQSFEVPAALGGPSLALRSPAGSASRPRGDKEREGRDMPRPGMPVIGGKGRQAGPERLQEGPDMAVLRITGIVKLTSVGFIMV
jgi:hypothetical protein